MAMTCLQMMQTVCKRIGILPPNAAVTSNDQQIMQLLALMEEEGQEGQWRAQWTGIQTEAIFTTVAAEVQGSLSTIAPGYSYIVDNTIWNRTLRRPVYGPKSEQDWQQSKAMQINGPFNAFRIMNGQIRFYPNPVAGQTCAFEYMSKNWISTSIGGTSETWTNDADTPLIDDKVIILGTIWRWKAAKGLDYAEDFRKYELRITDAQARDGGKPVLSADGVKYDIQPVIMVPTGSFGQ